MLSSESVSRKRLVNILNYVNFKGSSVVVNLRRLRDGSKVSLRAIPEPCSGENARLTWLESPPKDIDTDAAYGLVDFFIDMGSRVVIVNGRLADVNRSGTTILLPEHCHGTSRRRVERHASALVHVTLSRSGSEATGLLQDFGGASSRCGSLLTTSISFRKRRASSLLR